jgi:hypothetical protein
MQHTTKTNPVLTTARADYNEQFVAIDFDAIAKCPPAGELKAMGATFPPDSVCLAMEAIPFFIVMNSLNFQFWDVTDAGEFVRYRHEGQEGALAMRTAFQRVWKQAVIRADGAGRTSDIPFIVDEVREIFSREGMTGVFGDIPEPRKRTRIMMEMLEDGERVFEVSSLLHKALVTRQRLGWEEAKLLLADTFPVAYGDEYLKKAQLTLMFIAGQWGAGNPTRPCKLDVTAAADYQLPKILRAMGILRYSKWLSDMVDQQLLIEADSLAECAIRAATVLACEKLAEHQNCTLPDVDFWLWVNRNQARSAQFHLTRTSAY